MVRTAKSAPYLGNVGVEEAKSEGLSSRYHVYASLAPYTGSDIEFYKIPESVLEHIGFNPRADAFNNEENSEE